jgi:hypothetical protein
LTQKPASSYLINRYYDPTTAQFLSVDPAVSATQQPYAYVGDNPTNTTDPSGLMTPCDSADFPSASPIGAMGGCGLFLANTQNLGVAPGTEACLADPHSCDSGGGSGFLVIIGAVAGTVAFASGIGEIAAGAYGAVEGGEAIFLGVSAETYGTVGATAGTVAAGVDFPECAGHLSLKSCAGFAAGIAGLGAGLSAGEVDWEKGITAAQGLHKMLSAASGLGTTAWDGLKGFGECP